MVKNKCNYKILYITPGIESGGAENILFNIVKSKNIEEVIIISLTDIGFYGMRLINQGYKVYALNMQKNFLLVFKFIYLVILIKKFRPKYIHTWLYHANLIGGIAGKIARVKRIYWSIHHDYEYSNFMMMIEMKILTILSYLIPNKIIYCSKMVQKNHIKNGYKKSISQTIENGISTSQFKPNKKFRKELRNQFNIGNDCLLLGNVSRYHPIKDHENLFKALSLLNKEKINFKCILVGRGLINTNKDLLKKIKKFNLSDKVILYGKSFEIYKIMAGLDLHILSSKKEAFGMVLLEAMSTGIPCLSTDVGEAKNIIGNTGWIVNVSDPSALAFKISKIVNEKINLDTFSSLRRERILRKYSLEKMIKSYSEIYKEINL